MVRGKDKFLVVSLIVPAGVLRVKTHKQSGARRLLLRNSSTGKINIVCRPSRSVLNTMG